MTLIVSVATWHHIVQVSDRRTTLLGQPVSHDERANKTLVVHALDALAAISYTGPAYVGNTPTDDWMADLICNAATIDRGHRIGPHPGVRDIGQIVKRLDDKIAGLLTQHKASGGISFTTAGIRWHRRRKRFPLPFVWSRNDHGVGRHRPRRDTPGFVVTGMPYGWLLGEDAQRLVETVRAAIGDPDALEQAVVGAIRRVADREPQVGHDCMSVVISRAIDSGSPMQTRVRFFAQAQHTATHDSGDIPINYAPWIIAAHESCSPSFLLGPHTFETLSGGVPVRIKMDFPALDTIDPVTGYLRTGVPLGGFSVQTRPLPPGRGTKPPKSPHFPAT
jgi:hypothetical protein